MVNCIMDSYLIIDIYQIISRKQNVLIQSLIIDIIEKTAPISHIKMSEATFIFSTLEV